MGLREFAEFLPEYRQRVRVAGHDARRNMFFDLAQRGFGVNLMSWEVEAGVYRGWVDAILGTLVFEFKTDLAREMPDAHRKVRHYLLQLHERSPSSQYTVVITDGLTFHLYQPEYEENEVRLQPLPSLDLATLDVSRPDAVAACYYQLDSLLASFQRETVPPSVEHIVANLGAGSAAFGSAIGELRRLYDKAAGNPAVDVRFSQWDRYLGIVLGESPQDVSLFLRHSFLATLNKLVAYLTLEPTRPPATDADLGGILTGRVFADMGIHNFIEEDFFTWFLAAPIQVEGLAFLHRLVGTLRRYDFRQVTQDVLKELYQQIVERDARHDIGEYYTPDWLAELILRQGVDLPDRPDASLLDPACGSGTFLFLAVRLASNALRARGWQRDAILRHVLENIRGIDVHPVAVITARTNYLMALGDLLHGERPAITVPVYLADSLLPPEPQPTTQTVVTRRGRRREQVVGRLEEEPVLPWQPGEGRITFEYPASLVSQPQALDALVNAMGDQLRFLQRGSSDQEIARATEAYRMAASGRARRLDVVLSAEAERQMTEMFRLVADLYSQGKDTVWLFLLKNVPRPTFLREQQVDIVVGNPPWLSLRYFKGAGYARRVKRAALEEYNLRPYAQTHLATQMELATLFFARSVDLYLRQGGTIGFVMPRSIMVAQQHSRFNEFSFKGGSLQVRLDSLLDLEGVSPLFNVPSCVLVATKGAATSWPVPATRYTGELDARNLSWQDVAPRLSWSTEQLQRVDGKMLFTEQAASLEGRLGRSPYAEEFAQGATIVPRAFWFVRRQEGRFGFPADAPLLETDEEAVRQAKQPWRAFRLRGPVEGQFVYATLPSGDVLPFGYTKLSSVVLPILPQGSRYRLLDVTDALGLGFPQLAAWLREAQQHWESAAARDTEGHLKIERVVRRLDYHRTLTSQRPDMRYKVVYGRSGTNLTATVIDVQTAASSFYEQYSLYPSGFVVDSTNHYAEMDNADEAYYLASILNSETLDHLIKPLQTRGLWGERDIYQLVWKMHVPRFDPDNAQHQRLAEVARACHNMVLEIASQLGRQYRSTARKRAAVRDLLRGELVQIDRLARGLLE